MTTLQASRLKGLLDQAKNIGLCEESVTVAGLEVTVRNLKPQDYSDIYKELEPVEEGVEYMHAHQIEHVSRAICEIAGQDLRDVEFIEVERLNDKEEPVTVNIPRHEWVKEEVISTWGREAIHVVHRKFLDAAAEAEKKSREGVSFKIPDETDEEKFRRLLNEAMAAAEELPDDMRNAILKESDLLVATSEEELKAANERAKQFLVEQRARREAREATQEEDSGEEPQEPSQPVSPPPPVTAPRQLVEAAEEPLEPSLSPEELMARRTPLNREAIEAPVPKTQDVQTVIVNKRPPPPPVDQVVSSLSPKAAARAAQYAALEANAGAEGLDVSGDAPPISRLQHDVETVIESKVGRPGKPVIGGGPKGGINKHFVDGTKGLGGIDPRNRGR